jgi:hypothetical protein
MRSHRAKYIVAGDECLVYHSKGDNCWLAHSLHTDQIGTGKDIIGALVELLESVRTLLILSKKRTDIRVQREAPAAVQKRAQKAILLPNELLEIACKRALGEWPKQIKLIAEPEHKHPLLVRISGASLRAISLN